MGLIIQMLLFKNVEKFRSRRGAETQRVSKFIQTLSKIAYAESDGVAFK